MILKALANIKTIHILYYTSQMERDLLRKPSFGT